MTQIPVQEARTRTFGDAAVDGLLYGVAAGAVMAVYLAAYGLFSPVGPAAVLGNFDPAQNGSAAAGTLTHMAVAGVYGCAFGLAMWALSKVWQPPLWLAGLIYGLLLLTLALSVLLRGVRSPLLTIPPLHFAIAHGLYGLALGTGLARHWQAQLGR